MRRKRSGFRGAEAAPRESAAARAAVNLDAYLNLLRSAADMAYPGAPAALPQPEAVGVGRYRFVLEAAAAAALIVGSGAWLAQRVAEFASLLGEAFSLFL